MKELMIKALEYRDTMLWENIWDIELFAIKLHNGENGYISVMGQNGEYIAVGLYIGEKGISSYLKMINNDSDDKNIYQETLLSQHCLQLVFEEIETLEYKELGDYYQYLEDNDIEDEDEYIIPSFLKFEYPYAPSKINNKEDIKLLTEALDACLILSKELEDKELSDFDIVELDDYMDEVPLFKVIDNKLERIGEAPIPSLSKEVYEDFIVNDLESIEQIKQNNKNYIYETQIVRVLEPVEVENEERAIFPLILLFVRKDSKLVFTTKVCINMEEMMEQFLKDALYCEINPKEIRCKDERTYAFFKDFGEKANVKVVLYNRGMRTLEEFNDELFDSDDNDDKQMLFNEVLDNIISLDQEEFNNLPEELSMLLNELLEYPELDEELREDLVRKLNYKKN